MSKRARLVSILETLEHAGNMVQLAKLLLRYAPESDLPRVAVLVGIYVRWERRFLAAQS